MSENITETESTTRSITKSGGSKVVTIPPDFLEDNDLDTKDKVRIRWRGEILEVKPLEENDTEFGLEKEG